MNNRWTVLQTNSEYKERYEKTITDPPEQFLQRKHSFPTSISFALPVMTIFGPSLKDY